MSSNLDRTLRRARMPLLCVATVITGVFLTTANNSSAQAAKGPDDYLALVKLFQQWRNSNIR